MSLDMAQSTLVGVTSGGDRHTSRAGYELSLRDPSQAVEFLRRAVYASRQRLSEWHAQASVNLAWTAGKQFTNWDKSVSKLVTDPRYDRSGIDKRAIPMWTNRMRRFMVSSISRVTNSRITWTASPETNDQADIETSNALKKLLPHWWKKLEMDDQEALNTAWWYLFGTGVVYANPVWDEDSRERRIIPAEEIGGMIDEFVAGLDPEAEDYPQDDESRERRFFAQEIGVQMDDVTRTEDGSIVVGRGQSRVHWLSGFDIVEDLSSRAWCDKRWVIVRHRLPVATVRDRYGKAAKHVTGKPWGDSEGYSTERSHDTGDAGTGIFEETELYVVWHRECREYKRGYFVDICEGKRIRHGDNPYDHTDIPVIPIYQMSDPWGPRPTCTMDDLLPIQRAFNRLDCQIISHINQTVDPDWQGEEGSCPPDYMQEHPQIHFHNVGRPVPTPAPVQQLAQHVVQEKLMLGDQFDRTAGITDPNQGVPSSDARSGRAIFALNEREDAMFNMTVSNMERGLEDIGTMIIALEAQFGNQEQVAYVLGSNNQREAITYRAESFIAKAQNQGVRGIRRFDIAVEIAVKPSAAELRDEIDWYLERGLANAESHRDELMTAIRDGDLRGFDPTKYDRANVQRENEHISMWNDALVKEELGEDEVRILFEQAVFVHASDNPTAHIRGHEQFLKMVGNRIHPVIEELAQQHNMAHTQDLWSRSQSWGGGPGGGQQQQQQGLRPQRPGGGNGSGGVPSAEISRHGR